MSEGKFGGSSRPEIVLEPDPVPEHVPSDESVRHAWEAKRDEYLFEAVREVLKGTDKRVADKIFADFDAPEWAGVISSVRSQLIDDHKIPWNEYSISGEVDTQDANISGSLASLEEEYPEEAIRIQTITAIELGN
jgi:hypothetical protein